MKYLVFLSVAFVCWSCDQRTDLDESLETKKLKAETEKLKVEKEILEMQLKRYQVEQTKNKTANKPKQLLSADEVNKILDSLNFKEPRSGVGDYSTMAGLQDVDPRYEFGGGIAGNHMNKLQRQRLIWAFRGEWEKVLGR